LVQIGGREMQVNEKGNLFGREEAAGLSETVRSLFVSGGVRIEQIVSHGHASAPGFWYEQEMDEWVAVLEGEAVLEWEDGTSLRMVPGDWVLLPALERHRVAWTAPDRPTVWLAVFAQKPGMEERPQPCG